MAFLLLFLLIGWINAFSLKLEMQLSQTLITSMKLLQDSTSFTTRPKLGCLMQHCAFPVVECLSFSECRTTMECFGHCQADNVTCSNECFLHHSNQQFIQLSQCLLQNQCMNTTITGKSCPIHGHVPNLRENWSNELFLEPNRNVTVARVARGVDRLLDCMPCQIMTFERGMEAQGVLEIETQWKVLFDGQFRSANYTLRQVDRNVVIARYSLFGMDVEEHYYILDFTSDGQFLFYFYCGFSLGGEYQGALVYTRDKDVSLVPDELLDRFDGAVQKAGLEDYVPPLSQFCIPDYQCGQ